MEPEFGRCRKWRRDSGDVAAAQTHIDDARTLLDPEFTALVGESYQRAYRGMIHVLQLCELEEILLHQQRPHEMPAELLTQVRHVTTT